MPALLPARILQGMTAQQGSSHEPTLGTGSLYVGNERLVCTVEALWAQGVVLRTPASVPVGLFARLHVDLEGGLDLDTVVRKQHGTTWTGFRIELELYEPSLVMLQRIDRVISAPRKSSSPVSAAPQSSVAREAARETKPASTRSVAGLSAVRTQQGVAAATPLETRSTTRAPEDRQPPRARQTAARGIPVTSAPTPAPRQPVKPTEQPVAAKRAAKDAGPLAQYRTDAAALLSIYRDAVKDIDGKSRPG